MLNYRTYGKKPYNVVVVHGGPGAPGSLGYVAKELSKTHNVLEPFQSAGSVAGQIEELHNYINGNCAGKTKLIGHSWGAWLAYIYTAMHPEKVKKLILVAAGSFDERYNFNLTNLRLSRLSEENRKEALEIINWMNHATEDNPAKMKRFSELMELADFYDCEEVIDEATEFQYDIFQSVWKEADKMRRFGELMQYGKKIKCPVIAIHGNYDTHPALGVEEPLSKLLKKNFRFIGLDQCGHYPWKEKHAKDKFFEILETELSQTPPVQQGFVFTLKSLFF